MSTRRRVGIVLGSLAHRRFMGTFKALGNDYELLIIASHKCTNYGGENNESLSTCTLISLRDIIRHIPKIRHKIGWGTDQYLFGLDKALDEVDVVLAHSATAGFTHQAALHCERTGKPLIIQEVENIPFRDLGRSLYQKRIHALSIAKRIVAVTERTKSCLIMEGVASDKLRLLPYGTDMDLFHPGARNAGMREKLGLTADQTVVLFAGNIEWTKGIFDIVHAAKLLAEDAELIGHDLRFVIAGKGWESDALRARIEYLKLSNRIKMISGIPFERMPELYGAVDMVVAPSIPSRNSLEQWCLVLSEAMAVGVPVISTCCGGIPEVVDDCGLLIQPADPLSLADAIKRLACDIHLRQRLGEAGQARVREKFHHRVVGSQYADLLNEVLGI